MRFVSSAIFAALLAIPFAAFASYNEDGAKWDGSGSVDYVFSSTLYSTSQTGYPVVGNCGAEQYWDDDGNPATVGFHVDAGALTSGMIPYVAHLTGTLDTTTGALTASEHRSGLNVPFTVNVPGIGNIGMVLTSSDLTLNTAVAGHDWCFINGQWRDLGTSMTSIPATSSGVLKGYYNVLFHPTWTLTLSNLNLTFIKCERPGVTISGTLTMESYVPSPAGLPAEVWVRNGTTQETSTVNLDASGNYSVVTHIPGTVDVLAKVTHWLRAIDPGISTNSGNVSGADMYMVNGDASLDNAVNLLDLSSVLAAFGSNDPDADLDGSGTVNLIELSIILANFGMHGAE